VSRFNESTVEQAALAWLEGAGWQVRNGAEIAPGEPAAERDDYAQPILERRLRDALARINPGLPADALDEAFRKLTRPEGADLLARNRSLHRLVVDGVTVEYRDADGGIRGAQTRVIDFDDPSSKRLAGGQPVHGRPGEEPPARRGRVRQRHPTGPTGVEEPRERARDFAHCLEPGPDLPDRHSGDLHPERRDGHLGWDIRRNELVLGGVRALRPLEDHRRPGGGHRPPRAGGPDQGGVRTGPLPGPDPPLRRVLR